MSSSSASPRGSRDLRPRDRDRSLDKPFGGRASILVLLGLTAFGLFLRLDAAPVAMHSEKRCFEVAQHMVDAGNWLVPVRKGKLRLQKPPLCYWAAALGAGPDGEISRFALRAPAALAALALVGVVFAWGRALGGNGAGMLAALSLLGTSLFWTLGRRGVAEMPLSLFTTLGLFTFSLLYWDRRERLLPVFFLAVVLGFFAKATTAWLVIGLPIAIQLALDHKLARATQRRVLIGGLLCALACLSWYVAVLVVEPASREAFRQALLLPVGLAQSTGDTTHYRPPWYYLPLILLVASPALLLAPLPFKRVAGRRIGFEDPRTRFIGLAIASLFLFFSAIPMKQKHYLLPILPLFAVLVGYALHSLIQVARPSLDAWLRGLGVVFLASSPIIGLALVSHLWLTDHLIVGIASAAFVLLAAATGFAASRIGSLRVFAASALVAMTIFLCVKETSFTVWCGRFKTGSADAVPGFRAERWRQAFEAIPPLRKLYEARDWPPTTESSDPRI